MGPEPHRVDGGDVSAASELPHDVQRNRGRTLGALAGSAIRLQPAKRTPTEGCAPMATVAMSSVTRARSFVSWSAKTRRYPKRPPPAT